MPNVTVACPHSYPASRTALASCPTPTAASSYSTAAFAVAKLTLADATPRAAPSACWTVWAQAAQLMPPMGRMIRCLAMAAVGRGRGESIARRLDHQQSLQHGHPTPEGILTRLARREFDGGGLEGREQAVDTEVLEHHPLGAISRLVTIELQPHGLPGLHENRVRGVPALHRDGDLLHRAPAPHRGTRGGGAGEEEVPQHPDDGGDPERGDDQLRRGHVRLTCFRCASDRRTATRTPPRG